ncbi:Arm DNA-binding domain-containing protein [Pseudomonas putida]|uniref:Arm DNA-binding domain-containing protein n=1 Tax=Pseudomonas putida TaxID=303 RepID=UPI001E2C95F9|nr:Arm DNA-binding domain-containing protein [Pseudomonas putida]MDG9813547.1 Arm DNA-binding domain-containing protein [Pseudomonas putida]
MPLTDTAVRQAKPTGKNYTLKDTAGLALFVGAKGAKQWHFRFYWLGKQARISLGVYPAVSLKEAREARDKHGLWSLRGSIPVPIDVRFAWRPVQRPRIPFVQSSTTGRAWMPAIGSGTQNRNLKQ